MHEQANEFILVVDDNSTNLSVLSHALKQVGLKVRMAMDGTTALNIAQQHSPELILLDVQMPGIDGFETCSRLKANPLTQSIPIIFTTALADAESKIKGLSLGAVDYIPKPFEEQEVIARVNIHLQLRQLTKDLEKKTQQLKEKNLHLEQAIEEVKRTQTQLILAERMSALGHMVAGIAHELNNPVSFIYGNLTHASEYIQDLFKVINIYQQEYPQLSSNSQKILAGIDLDFIAPDLAKLLDSMYMGAKRIRDIVLSLRTFSRLDEAEIKAIDIHESINSTLLLLQHRLQKPAKDNTINVIKEYAELPLVTCYGSHLNQVFLNILSNAIDALAESEYNKSFEPFIRIRTELASSEFVKIIISDNGAGIAPDVQQNIFNPFFTTKPVGRGAGLGLAISYQIIVQKHRGQLICLSEPLKGAEFMIQIPIEIHRDDNLTTMSINGS
jgi:two-component system NtrC family sensor kinase